MRGSYISIHPVWQSLSKLPAALCQMCISYMSSNMCESCLLQGVDCYKCTPTSLCNFCLKVCWHPVVSQQSCCEFNKTNNFCYSLVSFCFFKKDQDLYFQSEFDYEVWSWLIKRIAANLNYTTTYKLCFLPLSNSLALDLCVKSSHKKRIELYTRNEASFTLPVGRIEVVRANAKRTRQK